MSSWVMGNRYVALVKIYALVIIGIRDMNTLWILSDGVGGKKIAVGRK